MDYFDYRKFISEKILEVCPESKEHKKPFDTENIDSITAADGYHFKPTRIDPVEISPNCQIIEDALTIELQLLSCGGRYPTEEADKALGKASCIRGKLIDRSQFPIDDTLERVEVTEINIDGQETNDNTVIVNLIIILHLNYCVEC